MTSLMFIVLLGVLSIVSGLVTQALKVAAVSSMATNVLALIDAVLVGGGGAVTAYIFLGIPFTPVNILCIVLLAICVWIGSMTGFDKVQQTIEQIMEMFK